MKNFKRFIYSQACSLPGGYLQTAVLSWVAAELGSGLYSLAAYLLACYLPVALLSYPFGRWLDRRPQKIWLVGSESLLAALSLVLWLRSGQLTFPFLLGFGALWGVVRALQTPLCQSIPRRLAGDLSKGTAALTVVTDLARGAGPVLGGILYQKWGAGPPFLLNFISFIPSVIFLSTLKLPPTPPARKIRVRNYLAPLGKLFAVSFLAVNYNVTFVALVKKAGLQSGSYGLALGLLGVGALLGFWLKLRISARWLLLGMALLNAVLAVVPGLLWQGVCILLYGGLDFYFFSAAACGLSQRAAPQEIGGVMGLYTVVTVGAVPLGAWFWSMVSKAVGLRGTFWILGGGLLLLSLLFKGDFYEKRNEDF